MYFKKISVILITLFAIMVIPYIGAYVSCHGHIPTNYFDFPPIKHDKPKANSSSLIVAAILFIVFCLLYFFPQLFGFKKKYHHEDFKIIRKYLPQWFWIGLFFWAGSLLIFITKVGDPKWITNWTFIPLCWGFIFMLDGLVFYVNDGDSLVSSELKKFIIMGFVSIPGWLIFEYLNFFVNNNWYYPHALSLMSKPQFCLYAVLGSSAFIPMAFEWYLLLKKIKILNYKYLYGPKVHFPPIVNSVLLLLCLYALYTIPFHPDNLFYLIWVAPVIIIAIVLTFLKIKTPFTCIKDKGDWTYVLLFALTFLIQGFFLEAWNYLSGTVLENGKHFSNNPAYWMYCIPFVYKYCVFEMPFFGYMGYLLFSLHCWLWWRIISDLFIPSQNFTLGEEFV